MSTPEHPKQPDAHRGLNVAMFTPFQGQCGISDYSQLLADALRALPEIADVCVIPTQDLAVKGGVIQALARFPLAEREYAQLAARLNAKGTDIAHIQHQYFFFGGVAPHKNHARAFLAAIRVPLAVTVHEIARPPTGASWALRQAIAVTNRGNFLHPHIGALIVHTDDDRDLLLKLGAHPARVHVVTHAIPPALCMPEAQTAKRELGLEGRRVVTLFGFLSQKKGHLTALTALSFLPNDVTLLFAGGQHPQDHTNYVDMLRKYILSHRLEDRVRITGYLDAEEIPRCMAATDVAIAPFTQTSGSGSLANLFAYGRAVVASDIGPHHAILEDQPGCLELFAADDAAELARHVRAALNDANKRAVLQQAALAYARRHSYPAMAQQTLHIYRGLLAARSGSG